MSIRSIFIASVVLGLSILALAACASPTPTATPVPPTVAPPTAAAASGPTAEPARPSNPGGPGPAITQKLVGDPKAGEKVFVDNCKKCHGDQGAKGIENPGSTDGTIPVLNPIDETIKSDDAQVFATNVDLFVEHGSTPAGTNPKEVMDAWGDKGKLTPQQIADVIAYVISLNK